VIPAGAGAARILAVGSDAELAAALHAHAERAGWVLYTAPGPADLEPLFRAIAPHAVVLVLPPSPDATWGTALTAAQVAARAGTRVMMVAPSREVVEPLAAVAGAEKALARADVLLQPGILLDAPPRRPLRQVEFPRPLPPLSPQPAAPPPPAPAPQPAVAPPRPFPAYSAPPIAPPPPETSPTLAGPGEIPPRPAARPAPDLMALIDEELVEERRRPPVNARVEVSVSLVSEHNFYVGVTRRIDSGGVFIATSMPPPAGTRVNVRLGLADGRKLDLEGEVAFLRAKSATTGRQPAGCGVRLTGLPGWAVDAIERFFQARQPIVHAST
jgi:Tfp pilus assembly protein PilZ